MELKIKTSVELVRLTKALVIACGSDNSIPELNTDGDEGAIHPPVVTPFSRGGTLGGSTPGRRLPSGQWLC